MDADETWMVVDGYTDKSFKCFKEVDAIQYCNPSRPITIIQGVENIFRSEIGIMPGDKVEEIQKEEVFSSYLKEWIGNSRVKFMRTAVYSFHAASAEKNGKLEMLFFWRCCSSDAAFHGSGNELRCRDAGKSIMEN